MILMRAYATHGGWAHRQRVRTTFWLGKTLTNVSCTPDGVRTSAHGIHWIPRPTLYPLSHPDTPKRRNICLLAFPGESSPISPCIALGPHNKVILFYVMLYWGESLCISIRTLSVGFCFHAELSAHSAICWDCSNSQTRTIKAYTRFFRCLLIIMINKQLYLCAHTDCLYIVHSWNNVTVKLQQMKELSTFWIRNILVIFHPRRKNKGHEHFPSLVYLLRYTNCFVHT